MRIAVLAGLTGFIALSGSAFALDKVTFGTNWLADPEAGGYYQAVVDGTYAKYGLDVTILPGGPQSNGGMLLVAGKIEFFMGGDMIGDFLHGRAEYPDHRGRRRFPEGPADLHVASRRRAGQMDRSAQGDRLRQQWRAQLLLCLDAARLWLQGRERQTL